MVGQAFGAGMRAMRCGKRIIAEDIPQRGQGGGKFCSIGFFICVKAGVF